MAVHSSHHIALASHRHHSQLTSKLFAEHAHYIAVTRRLYTSSCETEDARRRVHHFTRRHGSLRDVATFSPYNTSHITRHAKIPGDLQNDQPQARPNVSDSPAATPSRRSKLSWNCTPERDINMQAQTEITMPVLHQACVNSRETGKLRTSRLLTPVDSSDENVRSSMLSTAVTPGGRSQSPIFAHNGLIAIALVLQWSRVISACLQSRRLRFCTQRVMHLCGNGWLQEVGASPETPPSTLQLV
jgi:hypothetical protein